ncbi:hypothetical protein Ana3638_23235 [Anaerocolumna sedimenticola]|uniref:BIG2 domain-containing protein n=1 Tax=Anaerocolumna sedimenticola TaxID=2696063 RepID=A0A6P1TQ07_9FIRM|nr:hypothetical protein [Anaerocolumna sedimenticola]QHQ63330.1 hypothetical protein Ana3638_23235 [Anaerocolumna sedimenticola]
MKQPKIKVTQLLLLIVLCCALMAGNFLTTGTVAEAAAKKAAVSTTQMTIPVGKMDSKICWNTSSWELSNAQKLTVKNAVKGATYQFTSSSTKVVTIAKTGGYLTGVKAGSATITCTQTYKGKKTTVGKCKVTVKNAALTVSDYGNEFPVGSGGFSLYDYYASSDSLFSVTYRNPKATYTLTSDNENFSMKEVKYDASKAKEVTDNAEFQSILKDFIGSRYFYGYQFTAKKAGTYTVTVKETYNKKARTLGSFKVVIKDTAISESQKNLLLGDSLNALTLLTYAKANTQYYFEIKDYDETNPDNNVLSLNQDGSELYINANKTGTAEVTVKEGSEQGTVIGTVTFTVSEAPCQSIILDSNEYTTYVGDDFYIYFDLEPWDTTDQVTIESENPDVLKVEYNQEEGWIYTPLKVGEANVTIKCGSQSATCKVIVEEY